MQRNILMIVKNFKPALAVVFVALVGISALNPSAFAMIQTAAPQKELATATEAKRALADIGTRDFKRVKDARLRDASGRALTALKALARNTSKAREAELVASFDRSITALKALPTKPTAMSLQACDATYEKCVELCKLVGSDCKLCGIAQNGCYLVKLAFEIAQEGDPSKD